jgi:hypothetical protein
VLLAPAVCDDREPAPETYALHWEFDVWLIADEPYDSLTPLQALPPMSWEEAPQRLNGFLKPLASEPWANSLCPGLMPGGPTSSGPPIPKDADQPRKKPITPASWRRCSAHR